jgi:hypothetical protein
VQFLVGHVQIALRLLDAHVAEHHRFIDNAARRFNQSTKRKVSVEILELHPGYEQMKKKKKIYSRVLRRAG